MPAPEFARDDYIELVTSDEEAAHYAVYIKFGADLAEWVSDAAEAAA